MYTYTHILYIVFTSPLFHDTTVIAYDTYTSKQECVKALQTLFKGNNKIVTTCIKINRK